MKSACRYFPHQVGPSLGRVGDLGLGIGIDGATKKDAKMPVGNTSANLLVKTGCCVGLLGILSLFWSPIYASLQILNGLCAIGGGLIYLGTGRGGSTLPSKSAVEDERAIARLRRVESRAPITIALMSIIVLGGYSTKWLKEYIEPYEYLVAAGFTALFSIGLMFVFCLRREYISIIRSSERV